MAFNRRKKIQSSALQYIIALAIWQSCILHHAISCPGHTPRARESISAQLPSAHTAVSINISVAGHVACAIGPIVPRCLDAKITPLFWENDGQLSSPGHQLPSPEGVGGMSDSWGQTGGVVTCTPCPASLPPSPASEEEHARRPTAYVPQTAEQAATSLFAAPSQPTQPATAVSTVHLACLWPIITALLLALQSIPARHLSLPSIDSRSCPPPCID